ncbi:MAG: hypothetical protein H6640_17940 [Caldilineaceae bacterium]|nr:hypothetical protein [Caldilineaceae bacterium]MCB9121607.1 hypothetical protein [Caldilineaceae bacterium]
MSTDVTQAAAKEAAWPAQRRRRTQENPERLAWTVLIASFTVFMALLIVVPLSIRYGIEVATVKQTAVLDPAQGTTLLYPPGSVEPIAITELRDDITEGSTVEAGDGPTQATVRIINEPDGDQALGSVQIFSGTRLRIDRMRSPMFDLSGSPYQAVLALDQGQARVFTNSGEQRPLAVRIVTPHGDLDLDAGSYQIAVTEEQTDITVSAGEATLTKDDGTPLVVETGRRAWLTADALAGEALPAAQNLLRNGNFTESMKDTWDSYVVAENVTPGKVSIMERDGRRVAYFVRQGEDNVPTEVGIRQVIGKDVNVYDKLYLQLDIKLLFQSLSGAGYLSSEYPLRVELTYTDVYGKQLTWGHGFYYRDPENENWKIVNGEKVPPFNWYTYRSPDLMELLKETRPAHIDSIRIYASGWNYQSMVSEAFLVAE